MKTPFLVWICYFCLSLHPLWGQDFLPIQQDTSEKPFFVIQGFIIEGNEKTKKHIITRELDFKVGDTLYVAELDDLFQKNANQIINTRLFNEVQLENQPIDYQKSYIRIILSERWYTFPVPTFELADRNFNEWWQDRDRDLSRTIMGIRFYQFNMRGRGEKLKAVAQLGFMEKLELFYDFPYIDKNLKYGMSLAASYSRAKQIPYTIASDKLVFHADDDYIRSRFYSGVQFFNRKGIFDYHRFELMYHQNEIGDTISQLNPNYFGSGNTRQQYFRLSYLFEKDTRDLRYYALNGSHALLRINQLGVGIFGNLNMTVLSGQYRRFRPLNERFFWSASASFRLSTPSQQPFFNESGLGYEQNFVRAYELEVINGQHYLLQKNNLRYKFLDFVIRDLKYVPIKKFSTIPIAAYLKLYADFAYLDLRNPTMESNFNNQLLMGYGLGLDLVTFYDFVFRFEYSFDRNFRNGFFLHFESEL